MADSLRALPTPDATSRCSPLSFPQRARSLPAQDGVQEDPVVQEDAPLPPGPEAQVRGGGRLAGWQSCVITGGWPYSLTSGRRDILRARSSHKNHAIKVLPPDAKLSKAVRFSVSAGSGGWKKACAAQRVAAASASLPRVPAPAPRMPAEAPAGRAAHGPGQEPGCAAQGVGGCRKSGRGGPEHARRRRMHSVGRDARGAWQRPRQPAAQVNALRARRPPLSAPSCPCAAPTACHAPASREWTGRR